MTAGPAADQAIRKRPQLTAQALLFEQRFPARVPEAEWAATRESRRSVLARLLEPPFTVDNSATQYQRRFGLIKFLDWLEAQPGRTWQDRWVNSGIDSGGHAGSAWRDVPVEWLKRTGRTAADGIHIQRVIGAGLRLMMCGDVIRPSISWLLTARTLTGFADEMARVRDPDGFATLHAASRTGVVAHITTQGAINRISFILAAKGGTVRDITVGDCIELVDQAYQHGRSGSGGEGAYFYQLLYSIGAFPADAPPTVRMIGPVYQGQSTPEELIDRYDLTCLPVRHLLVEYLRERKSSLSYTSLDRLANHLGNLFWKDLEKHHPGISSLDIPPDIAVAWKQRIQTTSRGGPSGNSRIPRLDTSTPLHAVRAFYLDIAQWAVEDPRRWAPWVARCPIKASDIQGRKEHGRRKSRMDQRTRERIPVVDAVAAALDQARDLAAKLLAAAHNVGPGEKFTAAGTTLSRAAVHRASPLVWAEDAEGTRRNLIREEDNAFWAWAAVEVLRHTGIRVEELTELTHHSLVQYRMPDTGEVVPLLHIAPSKTDQERLLVISPELADVLATVLQRVRTRNGIVPLVAIYGADRIWSPSMPLLFQHYAGMESRPFTSHFIERLVRAAVAGTSLRDALGEPLKFAPHDFRRIFATEAMLNGMPPHIAQLLLGHKDINVTMGYKAAYPIESINAHRAFLGRRRRLRPSEEYRSPTNKEWEEFLGHFQRRRLELGECGRAYGSSCVHEHSCIRCPLLRIEPTQRPRLESIRDNLTARIAEADREGWTGEAEGLNVSLAAVTAKLVQLDMPVSRRAAAVDLGMPKYSDIAGRVATVPKTPA